MSANKELHGKCPPNKNGPLHFGGQDRSFGESVCEREKRAINVQYYSTCSYTLDSANTHAYTTPPITRIQLLIWELYYREAVPERFTRKFYEQRQSGFNRSCCLSHVLSSFHTLKKLRAQAYYVQLSMQRHSI